MALPLSLGRIAGEFTSHLLGRAPFITMTASPVSSSTRVPCPPPLHLPRLHCHCAPAPRALLFVCLPASLHVGLPASPPKPVAAQHDPAVLERGPAAHRRQVRPLLGGGERGGQERGAELRAGEDERGGGRRGGRREEGVVWGREEGGRWEGGWVGAQQDRSPARRASAHLGPFGVWYCL